MVANISAARRSIMITGCRDRKRRGYDREEWFARRKVKVNAYYSPSRNGIVYSGRQSCQPAVIRRGAAMTANYGALGAGDRPRDQPCLSDEQGTAARRHGTCAMVGATRNRAPASMPRPEAGGAVRMSHSPLEGYHVNGALTLGGMKTFARHDGTLRDLRRGAYGRSCAMPVPPK